MNAIILAGGESRRMGRNKALIERPDGVRQIDFIAGLAAGCCDSVYLSLREEGEGFCDLPVIADQHPGAGPVAALSSAAVACDGPLLVISCDLFLLDAATLDYLIKHRDPERAATCFRNRIDGRAEPLCAIYEASALEASGVAAEEGRRCVRKFLESLDPLILDLPSPAALDNSNTPEDLAESFVKLRDGVTRKMVKVSYFAKLREVRGVSEESVETLACTAAGLYEEISFRHRFPLGLDMLRVAINGDFSSWDAKVADGDEFVFLPPVAGG